MAYANDLKPPPVMTDPDRRDSSGQLVSLPFGPIAPEPLREFRFTANSLGRHRVTIYPGNVAQRFLPSGSLVIRFPDDSSAVITFES